MFNEFFTIGEVSKTTNIPISTLRYYDKVGLLSPAFKNDDTNYRYYTNVQIITLKIISHMRHLGFSIENIKSHFENMDYEHTSELFEKVLLETKLEIEKLKKTEKDLLESYNNFKENFELEKNLKAPFIDEIEDIKGIIYEESISNLSELSKVFKKIDKFESKKKLHPSLKGFKLSFKSWQKNRFMKDCFLASMKEEKANTKIIIPKGKYACVYGKGVFEEQDSVEELLNWIKNNGYTPKEEFYITFANLILFKNQKDFLFLLRIPIC
ncbi:MerR family transcriptional regulator [Cetobacterium somerae]|uniref:MerR family transcriptional regulator n=1 Tax=Cetobacterium somerae TaxID=188913 RepID=UPI003D7699BB